MIEQQLVDRFRDAVADEAPLGFDPDQVIDRVVKRGRRRKVIWAVAATAVEAVVVWTLVGAPGGDSRGGEMQAGHQPSIPVPPTVTIHLETFEKVLTADSSSDLRVTDAELRISDVRLHNPNGDQGVAQLKRGGEVIYEVSLEHFKDFDFHFNQPIVTEPGVPLALAVNCTVSTDACKDVSATITGVSAVQGR